MLLTPQVLTTNANLVLANKLVPQGVLYLIHIKTQLVIAEKFLGNADWNQEDMMDLAVEGARKGLCVVRLKQTDPLIYKHSSRDPLLPCSGVQTFKPHPAPVIYSSLAGPTFSIQEGADVEV